MTKLEILGVRKEAIKKFEMAEYQAIVTLYYEVLLNRSPEPDFLEEHVLSLVNNERTLFDVLILFIDSEERESLLRAYPVYQPTQFTFLRDSPTSIILRDSNLSLEAGLPPPLLLFDAELRISNGDWRAANLALQEYRKKVPNDVAGYARGLFVATKLRGQLYDQLLCEAKERFGAEVTFFDSHPFTSERLLEVESALLQNLNTESGQENKNRVLQYRCALLSSSPILSDAIGEKVCNEFHLRGHQELFDLLIAALRLRCMSDETIARCKVGLKDILTVEWSPPAKSPVVSVETQQARPSGINLKRTIGALFGTRRNDPKTPSAYATTQELIPKDDEIGDMEKYQAVFVAGYSYSGSSAIYDYLRGVPGMWDTFAAPHFPDQADKEVVFIQNGGGLISMFDEFRRTGKVSPASLFTFYTKYVLNMVVPVEVHSHNIKGPLSIYPGYAKSERSLLAYLDAANTFVRKILNLGSHAEPIDQFRRLIRNFIVELGMILSPANGTKVLLNNAMLSAAVSGLEAFPEQSVHIAVRRDPRDQYCNQLRRGAVGDVDTFIAQLAASYKAYHDACMRLQGRYRMITVDFEPFIQSSQYRKTLCVQLGIEPMENSPYLDPQYSSRNIGIYAAHPDQDAIRKIEQAFPELIRK